MGTESELELHANERGGLEAMFGLNISLQVSLACLILLLMEVQSLIHSLHGELLTVQALEHAP